MVRELVVVEEVRAMVNEAEHIEEQVVTLSREQVTIEQVGKC